MAQVTDIQRLAQTLAEKTAALSLEVQNGGDLPTCMQLANEVESIVATLYCAFSALDEIVTAQAEAQFPPPPALVAA